MNRNPDFQSDKNESNVECVEYIKAENVQLREALKAAQMKIEDLKYELIKQKQRSDNTAQSQNSKIKDAQTKLANVRSKAFRLQSTKSKLTSTIMELKEQNVLHEKFATAIEVRVCQLQLQYTLIIIIESL